MGVLEDLVGPAERVVEAFADAKMVGTLRDGGMFVLGWVVLLSSSLPGMPKDILIWAGSVTVAWFAAALILRSARSLWQGRER